MTTDQTNWERQGFLSKKVQDQIQAIADRNNSPHTRMTLLASLKDSLAEYDLDTEQKKEPATTKVKWQQGKGRNFLMYMTEDPEPKGDPGNDGPRTMMGSPPKEKYPFKIAYKLPYLDLN